MLIGDARRHQQRSPTPMQTIPAPAVAVRAASPAFTFISTMSSEISSHRPAPRRRSPFANSVTFEQAPPSHKASTSAPRPPSNHRPPRSAPKCAERPSLQAQAGPERGQAGRLLALQAQAAAKRAGAAARLTALQAQKAAKRAEAGRLMAPRSNAAVQDAFSERERAAKLMVAMREQWGDVTRVQQAAKQQDGSRVGGDIGMRLTRNGEKAYWAYTATRPHAELKQWAQAEATLRHFAHNGSRVSPNFTFWPTCLRDESAAIDEFAANTCWAHKRAPAASADHRPAARRGSASMHHDAPSWREAPPPPPDAVQGRLGRSGSAPTLQGAHAARSATITAYPREGASCASESQLSHSRSSVVIRPVG